MTCNSLCNKDLRRQGVFKSCIAHVFLGSKPVRFAGEVYSLFLILNVAISI